MTTNSNKPGALFWVIGVIALIWNLMGVSAYLMQAYQTESYKAMYTPNPKPQTPNPKPQTPNKRLN